MYFNLILGYISETLKWTCSGKSIGYQKPFKYLRTAVYNTLSLWCSVMKYGSGCETVAATIIKQIECDITPVRAEMTLEVLSGSRKHMSKKARGVLHKGQNEKSNIAQTHLKVINPQNIKKVFSDEGNQQLCIAALICLKHVINTSSYFLRPTVIQNIHETIFDLTMHVITVNQQNTNLYFNPVCREVLYDVIYAFTTASQHLCPSPIQLAIYLLIFSRNNDENQNVREHCNHLLKGVEKLIHPQKSCLYFPPDITSVKKAFKNYRSKMLLEDDDEEIIAVAENNSENNVTSSEKKKDMEAEHTMIGNQNEIEVRTLTNVENENVKAVKRSCNKQNLQKVVTSKVNDDQEKNQSQDIIEINSVKIAKKFIKKIKDEPVLKKMRIEEENIEMIKLEGTLYNVTEIRNTEYKDIDNNRNSNKNIINKNESIVEEKIEDDAALMENLVSSFVDELNEDTEL